MDEFLRFALLGIGVGAIYGLSAQGLVLIFLGNRVLNFSQGAIALLAAYSYAELTLAGVPVGLAAGLAIAISGAIGAVIEFVVMRPLRGASTVTRLVATIGLLTVIQSAAALRYQDTTQFVTGVLPRTPWYLTDTLVISSDRALLLVIGLIVTGILIVLNRRSRFGLATSAAAENPRAIEVLGWSSHTISLTNWTLGAALAGTAGVLVAPINGLSVAGMSNIVYGALAAALIGGFRSFGLAMAGGLVLGIAQAEAVRIGGDAGWSTAIPFIIIVATVLLRRNVLSVRGEVVRRLPAVGNGTIRPGSVLAAAVTLGCGVAFLSGNPLDAFITSLIAALIGLSVVVSTGYAGQLSLAQYAVAGLGALVAAKAAADLDLPFLLGLLVGIAAGVVAGALIGLLSLRVRGDTVAIVTLGMALAFQALVLSNPTFTGGISGVTVPSPSLFGFGLDAVSTPTRFAAFLAILVLVCALAVANIRRGSSGRRLIATRGSERAAETLGISVKGAKVYALAVAGGLAGLAGAVEAFSQPTLVFDGFTIDASMALLVAVVLSGAGYVAAGPIAGFAVTGGLVYYLLSLTGWQRYLPLALGVLLLVNLVLVPDGVIPQNARMVKALIDRLLPTRRERRSVAPSTVLVGPDRPVRVSPALLEISDLTVTFGGITALDKVSLSVRPGHVTGLIGPNGAGKTTFIDAVSGVTRRYSGEITYAGDSFGSASATVRARAGLGRTLQGLELFEDLSVLENLSVGSETRSAWSYLRDIVRPRPVKLSPAAVAATRRFGLEPILHKLPGELPYGQRRLVAIARAVASQPAVLLLDEPAAGLSAPERDELGTLIRDLVQDWGMGILLVEHDVELVMRVCDHITVLEYGRVIATGSPTDIRQDSEVRRAFLGESAVSQ